MRILVFSAHPDDAEFVMGGTLVQLSKKHELTMLVMSEGDSGSFGSAAQRRSEQEAAARLLGARLLWGGVADCHIEYTRRQAFALAQAIRDERPAVVFAPHWDQQGGITEGRAHPDHRALGLLVRDAARFARFRIPELKGEPHAVKQLLYYMVPAHRTPKIAVALTDADAFRNLLAAHSSQMQLKEGALEDYLLAMRRSAAQHYAGVEYAETFDCDEPLLIGVQNLF